MCCSQRAIHLELTDSMLLSDCLHAIRRFISYRGLPSVIYSDNFKTFVASAQKVQEVYGNLLLLSHYCGEAGRKDLYGL